MKIFVIVLIGAAVIGGMWYLSRKRASTPPTALRLPIIPATQNPTIAQQACSGGIKAANAIGVPSSFNNIASFQCNNIASAITNFAGNPSFSGAADIGVRTASFGFVDGGDIVNGAKKVASGAKSVAKKIIPGW